jgi:hypothetical protein
MKMNRKATKNSCATQEPFLFALTQLCFLVGNSLWHHLFFCQLSCLLLLISALPSAFRQESRSQPGTIRKLNDSLTLLSDVACLLHANLQVV